MGLINALSVPIMFLNMFGGIVAGIWLMFLGKWPTLGLAILAGFISTFTISIAMYPSMLLAIPGFAMIKRGTGILGHFLLFCASLYTFGVLWFWSVFIFGLFISQIGTKGVGMFPILLLAYSVATAPVGYMASKEKDSPATTIATFSTMLGCMLFMLLLIFGFQFSIANLVFIVVMAMGLFAQLIVSVQIATATRLSDE